MTTVTDVPRPRTASGVRAALIVAVCGSAMAGLVHAAAARAHEGDRLLVWMFVLCAAAQLGWAAVVALRPRRVVLVAGVVINGGAVLVWALTRTVGIAFVDSLAEVETVGTQDLAAALLAAASMLGAACMLARPVARTTIAPMWAGALAVVALLGTMPALRADHTHRHGGHTELDVAGHAHGDGDEHGHESAAGDSAAHDEHADEDHPHDDSAGGGDEAHGDEAHDGHGATAEGDSAGHGHTTEGTAPHDHPPGTEGDPHAHPPTTEGPHEHPDEPTQPDHPHPPPDPGDPAPTGPIVSLDDPRVTPAQRAIAVSLIDGVKSALSASRFPNVAAVTGAGYQWIGDGAGGGYQHYVNWTYYSDGIELNPSKIESIVVKDGKVVSGMYILNTGKTMANVPALAGPLTTWHDHQNLCFSGTQLVGIAVDGKCARGVLTPTPPMLHVWLVAHPCGPFAGIESHGGDCGVHAH